MGESTPSNQARHLLLQAIRAIMSETSRARTPGNAVLLRSP